MLIGALIIIVFGAGATLAGWDITGWFEHLWNTLTSMSVAALLGALALITLQTVTTAYAWYWILRYAYPDSQIAWLQVLACYAAAVALNWVVPANLGTLTMMLMFTAIIAAASFAGVLAGFAVQKVFYTVIGAFCYLYLFLTVGGSFDVQFKFISEHPLATVILLAGLAALIFLVLQVLRGRVEKWWEEAKVGAQIIVHPRAFSLRVVLPEAISWLAGLGIIAVFLAAYHIPVSFHTIMRVVAGNSIANATAVTPGGAGVIQGFNVLALKGITSSANANAYSVAQQLVVTAWSILLAIVLMARAFGWSGGRELVEQSYSQAREKSSEQAATRRAKRQARRGHGHPAERADEALEPPGEPVEGNT